VPCTPRAVCAGSFGAAFAKGLWPLVAVLTLAAQSLHAAAAAAANAVGVQSLRMTAQQVIRQTSNQLSANDRTFCIMETRRKSTGSRR